MGGDIAKYKELITAFYHAHYVEHKPAQDFFEYA